MKDANVGYFIAILNLPNVDAFFRGIKAAFKGKDEIMWERIKSFI